MGSFHKKHKTKDFVLKNFLHHKAKSTSLKSVLNFIKCLVYEFSRTIIPPFSICHFDHFQPADCWWRQRCEVETSNIYENQMQVGVTILVLDCEISRWTDIPSSALLNKIQDILDTQPGKTSTKTKDHEKKT